MLVTDRKCDILRIRTVVVCSMLCAAAATGGWRWEHYQGQELPMPSALPSLPSHPSMFISRKSWTSIFPKLWSTQGPSGRAALLRQGLKRYSRSFLPPFRWAAKIFPLSIALIRYPPPLHLCLCVLSFVSRHLLFGVRFIRAPSLFYLPVAPRLPTCRWAHCFEPLDSTCRILKRQQAYGMQDVEQSAKYCALTLQVWRIAHGAVAKYAVHVSYAEYERTGRSPQ